MKTFEEYLEEETAEYKYKAASTPTKTRTGHTVVGQTWTGPDKDKKGANIVKHKDSGKFYASGGSSTSVTKKTTFHDSAEEAAKAYHNK